MNNNVNVEHPPLIAFGISAMILLATVHLSGAERAGLIALEDGPAEYLQAGFYFAGMLISFWALIRGYHRLAAGAWAVICLVFFGEETSWLQRVFDYSVPWVEQNSAQGEFNLHNQHIFGAGRVLNENGEIEINMSVLLNSQNIFRICFFTYFLLLPLLSIWRPFGRFITRLGYVMPPMQLLVVVWPIIAITFVFTKMHVEPMKFYIAEVRETVYAATIFIYCLTIYTTGKIEKLSSKRWKMALSS
jgi:magnesium-transporting ATPase (P-type)